MRIVLSSQTGEAIYEQIKHQIKSAILSGELGENEALPSIRRLARDLKVSVITTTRAYSDLELEGFVQTLPKKGVYVKKVNDKEIREQYKSETRNALITALHCGRAAGLSIHDLHNLLDALEETKNG